MSKRNFLHCFWMKTRSSNRLQIGSDRESTHKLSDGKIIAAGAECFRCAEMLLQPSFMDKEASGIHNASSQSIMKCDADTCKDLHARVVLYGGVAVFPQIGERTAKECNVR